MVLNPNYLKEENPLKEAIDSEPACKNIKERYSIAEFTAIVLESLKRICPEMFSSTDCRSTLVAPSYDAKLYVPNKK